MHEIQEKLLALSKKIDLRGRSLREIGDLIGVKNQPQKIKHHLSQLEKKGFIEFVNGMSDMRQVKNSGREKSALVPVPIIGAANCGEANVLADNNIDGYLKVSPSLLKKKDKIFAIRAIGQSMNRADIKGEAINEGDFVIVDYILSIIDGAANIKKINIDEKHHQVILLSESSKDYPPIFIHEKDLDCYYVAGKILQVIKKPA